MAFILAAASSCNEGRTWLYVFIRQTRRCNSLLIYSFYHPDKCCERAHSVAPFVGRSQRADNDAEESGAGPDPNMSGARGSSLRWEVSHET